MMKIDVAENGIVSVREELDGQFHRRTILPGTDYSAEQAEIASVCKMAHTPGVVEAFNKMLQAMQPSPEVALAQWRANAKCSPMQGKLALGQVNWAKIEAYRATATWAEQVVIDSANEWRRNSQDIQFFGYMLEFSDEQLDELFRTAMQISQ